jgi:hypothetical protein
VYVQKAWRDGSSNGGDDAEPVTAITMRTLRPACAIRCNSVRSVRSGG